MYKQIHSIEKGLKRPNRTHAEGEALIGDAGVATAEVDEPSVASKVLATTPIVTSGIKPTYRTTVNI